MSLKRISCIILALTFLITGCKKQSEPASVELPLHNAARIGDIQKVKELLSKGADVNAANIHGDTALHEACKRADKELIALLLIKGANVNAQGFDLYTPLHLAAGVGHKPVVQLLLENGADINAKTREGQIPATIAMYKNNRRIADLLIPDDSNITIHLAAYLGDVEKTKSLIEDGVDINSQDENGYTPLHRAAQSGSIEVAQLLIASGADVNTKGLLGRAPLHEAARSGLKDVIELLLVHGAKVNEKTTQNVYEGDLSWNYWPAGATPLFFSTYYPDVVEILLEHGAEVNVINDAKESIIDEAIYHGNRKVVELLIASGVNINIHHAAYIGALEKVRSLIEDGSNINTKEKAGGRTPLHRAVEGGHKEVIKLLLENEADINIKNNSGETPLKNAVKLGYREIAELLISSSADINVFDKNGKSLLHVAASSGRKDMVELLLNCGIDKNISDKKGRTALDYILRSNFTGIVTLLGGDINHPDFSDNGPYSVIISDPNDVIGFLRFQGYDFDQAWIPEQKDIQGLKKILETFLRENVSIRTNTWVDREYILSNLRRYNFLYSGYILDDMQYIICQMDLYDGFDMYYMDSSMIVPNQFGIMADGGASVTCVIFDFQNKSIVSIDCNGGA